LRKIINIVLKDEISKLFHDNIILQNAHLLYK